jgi:hypothetical protein
MVQWIFTVKAVGMLLARLLKCCKIGRLESYRRVFLILRKLKTLYGYYQAFKNNFTASQL